MSDPINTKIRSETQRLLCRSELYGALAFLFRHPSHMEGDFSVEEKGRDWQQAVDILALTDGDRLKSSLDQLLHALSHTDLRKWARQHEDCFAHTAHGIVPSYELEYGEEHTHRQPQQLGDIAAFYNAFGLKINETVHERVDHVTVECEFMQFLLYKEAYAVQHDGEEQSAICRQASQRFLSEHLSRWIPAFALKLAQHHAKGIMNRIADFCFAFVTADCRQLGISPGPHDLPIRTMQEKEDQGCMSCSINPGLPPHI